ncbi:MAG: LLM class flavin-dependent oxidoreductase [Chloroflexota bacterium]
MRFGTLILPEYPWSEAKAFWQRAEELGFEHVWTYDHLTWRSFRDKAWYSAIPTLTAAALVTKRIRLGTMVASPNFRHPLPFVKELLTLDDVANGRLILGIGAGSSGWDATMLGNKAWTPAERAARFGEFVQLSDQLMRQRGTSFQGQYYSVNEARTYPSSIQQPRIPFAIAATGKKGMALVAKYADIWITNGDRKQNRMMSGKEGAQVVKMQMERLHQICEENGRLPQTLRHLVLTGPRLSSGLESSDAFQDTIGHYAEIGITDFVVHWPRPTEPYAANLKTFEAIFSTINK